MNDGSCFRVKVNCTVGVIPSCVGIKSVIHFLVPSPQLPSGLSRRQKTPFGDRVGSGCEAGCDRTTDFRGTSVPVRLGKCGCCGFSSSTNPFRRTTATSVLIKEYYGSYSLLFFRGIPAEGSLKTLLRWLTVSRKKSCFSYGLCTVVVFLPGKLTAECLCSYNVT